MQSEGGEIEDIVMNSHGSSGSGSWHHESTISVSEQSVATHNELKFAQAPKAIRGIHDDADDTVPL
jgi:hypothetical protein